VIAEIGVNHDGSLIRAVELVRHAARAGADAVKFQVFRAGSLIHPSARLAEYQREAVAVVDDPRELLRRYELSSADLIWLCELARRESLIPLATPFSPDDVQVVQELDLPAIKISSPDLVNLPLLERCAVLRRPMLVSTGAATMDEVDKCAQWLEASGISFALLHCVSAYPTPADQAHLRWIGELASRFEAPTGYSDHTTERLSGALAVAAGACVLERHLTYDKSAAGPDHAASSDPQEFEEYIRLVRLAEQMRGSGPKRVLAIERDVRSVSRQSLVLRTDRVRGQTLSPADLTVQRPGTGIPAGEAQRVIGRRLQRDLKSGTLLQWDMLSDAA
jgi:N-acetylneuraminate synthase/N,N'-diacetyllegionaminate synthase